MKISKRTKLIYRGEVDIYKRMDALPRVFIVHRALFEPDTQRSYTLIQKVNKQLREVVVINDEMDKEVVAQLATSPVIDKSQAAITKYTPNEVIVRAYLENPGILVFGDAYHPDWKVYVDDNPSKLYAAYYLGRGVFLPKGSHHVRFVFRPLSFYLGLAVSGICLVITVILIFLGSRTRREAR